MYKLKQWINLKRLAIYLLIFLTFFGYIYFGTIEIFFNNWQEYGYNFIALFRNIILDFLLYVIASTFVVYLISCIGNVARKIIEILLVVILIFGLINLVFFPVTGLLDGRESIEIFSQTSAINVLMLFVILIIVSLIFLKSKDTDKLLILTSLICSVYIVFNTGMAVVNSTYESKENSKLQISNRPEDILKLSDKRNIIYIVLDQYDSRYFNAILESNDNSTYMEMFKDFTYFNNYASAHPTTVFSGVASMAGKPYDNSKPYATFKNEVFSSGYSIFEKLKEEGWDNIISYGLRNSSEIYAPQYELYSNVKSLSYNKAPKYSEQSFINAAIYRFSPYFMRNYMKIHLATKNEYGWDFKFIEMFENNNILYNDKNVFMLLHMRGAHAPYVIDEHLNYSKNATSTTQGKAALKVVYMLIDKIRKTNIDMYNNSVIVVTTDHGFFVPNALCLIKGINEQGTKLKIDSRPLSQVDMKDILYNLQKGEHTNDIRPSTERKFYDYEYLLGLANGYFSDIYLYDLPKKLSNEKDYPLIKILRPAGSPIINDNVEIDFQNIEQLPSNIIFGEGWTLSQEGLVTTEDYKAINIPLESGKEYSIYLDIDYGYSDNSSSVSYATHNNMDGRISKKIPIIDNKSNYVLTAQDGVLLRFNTKSKIIINKLRVRVDEHSGNKGVKIQNNIVEHKDIIYHIDTNNIGTNGGEIVGWTFFTDTWDVAPVYLGFINVNSGEEKYYTVTPVARPEVVDVYKGKNLVYSGFKFVTSLNMDSYKLNSIILKRDGKYYKKKIQ